MIYPILLRETANHSLPMLINTPNQIVGHSDIKRAARPARQDIDPKALHAGLQHGIAGSTGNDEKEAFSPRIHHLVTTGVDPVVHAAGQRTKSGSECQPHRHMDCRVKAGNDDMKMRSRGASSPEFCCTNKEEATKEGSGAPRGASNHGRIFRRGARLAKARSPFGALLRRLPERANAPAQPRPRFTRTGGRGRYPHRHSRLSKAPCTPVVMPAGTLPRPPGSEVTSFARRNRTRSASGIVSRSVPHDSMSGMVTE